MALGGIERIDEGWDSISTTTNLLPPLPHRARQQRAPLRKRHFSFSTLSFSFSFRRHPNFPRNVIELFLLTVSHLGLFLSLKYPCSG